MREQAKKKNRQSVFSEYVLLGVLFSFLGWGLEMIVCRIEARQWVARGFLALPICPIYGVCVLFAYAVLGIPNNPRRWLNSAENGKKILPYLVGCFLIPSGAELLVGWFFDRMYHVKLWTYAAWSYNLCGYVCLPVSLLWTVLLFIIMRYAFPFFQARIQRLPLAFQRRIAAFLTSVTLIDGLVQFIKLSLKG